VRYGWLQVVEGDLDLAGVSMGAEPRYGTCCMLTPVMSLNSSPDMWIDVPVPDDAMLILPGLALAIGDELGNRFGRN
jgi:hypothetical protein